MGNIAQQTRTAVSCKSDCLFVKAEKPSDFSKIREDRVRKKHVLGLQPSSKNILFLSSLGAFLAVFDRCLTSHS